MSNSTIFGTHSAYSVKVPTQLPLSAPPEKSAAPQIAKGEKKDGITQYDFTKMTPQQMFDTMNHLVKTGQMDLDESSALVGVIPFSGLAQPGGGDAANRPMNFIGALEQQISFNESTHNAPGVKYGKMALDALLRFQGNVSAVDIRV